MLLLLLALVGSRKSKGSVFLNLDQLPFSVGILQQNDVLSLTCTSTQILDHEFPWNFTGGVMFLQFLALNTKCVFLCRMVGLLVCCCCCCWTQSNHRKRRHQFGLIRLIRLFLLLVVVGSCWLLVVVVRCCSLLLLVLVGSRKSRGNLPFFLKTADSIFPSNFRSVTV